MTNRPPTRSVQPGEQGFMLLAAVFLMALLILSLAVAIPKISKEIQRDREVETMERGKQYIRAVKLYYRKFGRYPPNLDALVKSNEIRFLRKKYVDPTTGKEEWKPIQFGQNKAPTAMGFFGQPLAGAMGGGGCNGIAGATSLNSSGSLSSVGGGATDVSGGSNIGNCNNAATGGTDTSTGSDSTVTGAPGGPASTGIAGATGTTTAGITSPATGSSPTGSSPTGQTFGGAGIIGFSPTSPKASILVYKKKQRYNEWEFVYDPIADQQMIPGGGGVQGATNPITGTGTSQGGLSPSPSPSQSPSPAPQQ